jgi:tetratricopeptide (TPR) repeat protein
LYTLTGAGYHQEVSAPALPPRAKEAAVPFARAWAAVLLLLALAATLPGAAPPARTPSAKQIARWVRDLGDDDFDTRERASGKLRSAGRAAERALYKAIRSTDREVVKRARDILADFKWGIYPDTPTKVVALIRQYQSSRRGEKGAVIQKLLAAGAAGCRALVKIATAETDPLVQADVFARLSGSLSRSVPRLIAEGKLDTLEVLLEIGLAGDVKTGAANYVAYWLLRGKLDERIAHHVADAKRHPSGKPQAEILAYLYRAKGDLVAARKAAEKAERNDLVEALLYEAGNWKELARRPELISSPDSIEKRAREAAYCRLAGKHKAYLETIATLHKIATSRGGSERPDPFPYAKALFLNDKPALALALLKGENLKIKFEVLAAQMKVREALAVVEKARKDRSRELPALEILEARTLHRLGEKDRALAAFKKYAAQIKKGNDFSWFEDLVGAEVSAGLDALAFEHAGRILSVSRDLGWVPRLFGKLFPDKDEEAETLWRFMRVGFGLDDPVKRLARLRALLEGKASAKDIKALGDEVQARGRVMNSVDRARVWLAAGEAAVLCKQDEQARRCFEKAGNATGQLRLGELLADRKKWAQAAECFRLAYQRAVKKQSAGTEEAGCTPELALYLHGWALVKSGKLAAGKKRMEESRWLPLGNGLARHTFARALAQRGHLRAARREFGLLRRLGEPVLTERDSYYTGEGFRAGALYAAARKEYLKAALGYEQAMLGCLRSDVRFVRPASYVTIPGTIHRLRARGLLAAGKIDEALEEADSLRAYLPGDVDLALALVPALDKRGRKKEAARLFAGTLAVYEQVGRAYPRCGWALNSAAWLSACCRRNLDKALKHARKAVTLEPKNSAYLDTLAEVYFQLGKKAEAIATQKKALALEPKNAYFKKQLKRLEAGDPKVERPAEEGEE